MSILTKEDRKDLVYAMRTVLLEKIKDHTLTEGKKAAAKDFILNEATYEQLLNLVYNPERQTNLKSIEVLEKVALQQLKETLVQESEKNPINSLTNEPRSSFLARQKWIKSTPKSIPRSQKIATTAKKYGQELLKTIKK